MKQKTGSGKASVTLSTDTTLTSGNSTDRWRAVAADTDTPDLIDASESILKTSKEKGSALLQRFVQQSNQNNLDERKAVWKGLDKNPDRSWLERRPDHRAGIH